MTGDFFGSHRVSLTIRKTLRGRAGSLPEGLSETGAVPGRLPDLPLADPHCPERVPDEVAEARTIRRFYTEDPWGNRVEFIDADRVQSHQKFVGLPHHVSCQKASVMRPLISL